MFIMLYCVIFVPGQAYYLNCFTKESQWDTPTKPAEPASSDGPEKVDFTVHFTFVLKVVIKQFGALINNYLKQSVI